MVSKAWPEEVRILVNRAMGIVNVLGMIGRNAVFLKEVIENVIPTIDRLEKAGKIRRRMLDTVKLAIYISDSESAIMFPNLKGEGGHEHAASRNDLMFKMFTSICLHHASCGWSCVNSMLFVEHGNRSMVTVR
jgi:hypothetical protein